MINKKINIILLSISLASCMKTLSTEEIGKKPTNEEAKEFVQEYIDSTFYDSVNVRNLRVKEPVKGKIFVGNYFPTPQTGWVICYQVNAKNLMGAYTGTKKLSVGVQNMELKPHGQVNVGWQNCPDAKWIK